MKQKLLSIILPTYNRGEIISYTLSLFHDQVVRNSDDVELIVCDNASTDNTKEVIQSILKQEQWFKCINYDEHVSIDLSILRSIDNVNGKFFWLFGDDDIPSPSVVDTLINSLNKFPQIGLLTFNRLLGTSDASLQMRAMSVYNSTFNEYEILYKDSRFFVEKYYGQMGFISVNVVRTEVWQKGLKNFDINHQGYSFLTIMFSGAMGYECLYLEYPLCVQRYVLKGGNEHEFSNIELGIYQFISIPRILKKLEELGAIQNWKQCFNNYQPNQNNYWYYSLITTIAELPEKYSSYYNELIEYQSNHNRIADAKKIFSIKCRKMFVLYKFFFKFKAKGGGYYIYKRIKKLIVK
jgi:glycosyltransferase involved in cell wall biosynthesis